MAAVKKQKKPAAKQKSAAKVKAKPKNPAPTPVETVDPETFPADLRAHAIELAPIVAALRKQAAKRPRFMKIGPPTTRERVAALAKHYKATLLPDYTALMMLADGIRVEDSYILFGIDDLTSAKVTKRSEKLRAGYSNCLPIGMFSLSGGWLFVMADWGEPYCEKIMGIKVQAKTVRTYLDAMLKDAKKLPYV